MKIKIIAAVDKEGLIGKEDGLPWHFPEDLRFFYKTTLGKFVIMGRKTFQGLPQPLEGRKVIVLSRDKDFENAERAETIDQALSAVDQSEEVFIAGGASIYRQFLPLADELLLTVIDQNFEGDIYFPEVDWSRWKLTEEKKGSNKLLTFKKYIKR